MRRATIPEPQDDGVLLAVAAYMVKASGGSVRCEACGGTGPVGRAAVVWRKAIADGGKREYANTAVACYGCASEHGTPGIELVKGSRIAASWRGGDACPIQVVEVEQRG